MKYALFAGESCYAIGGWLDFQSMHTSVESAVQAGNALMANDRIADWFHVVDLEEKKIVAYCAGSYCGRGSFPKDAFEVPDAQG